MDCGCGSPRKECYSDYPEEKGRKYYFCSFCEKSIRKNQSKQQAKIHETFFYFCSKKDYEKWLEVPNFFNAFRLKYQLLVNQIKINQ
tara:strand:- start:1495 stop:1755 length:261 start_codon:yes stop_codon:yes gene_type:complete